MILATHYYNIDVDALGTIDPITGIQAIAGLGFRILKPIEVRATTSAKEVNEQVLQGFNIRVCMRSCDWVFQHKIA
jgi:hypothetical protein